MSEQREEYRGDDRTPRDKKENVIGIGDTLVVRVEDKKWRYKVLAIDTLQGSGSAQVECLDPVEPGFERRWVSRWDLWQTYEIETKATHEYPASFNIDEYEQQRTRDRDYNEREQREAIRDTQGGMSDLPEVKRQYNLPAIKQLQAALDIQRKYEQEQIQGMSLHEKLANLYNWSPSFVLDTMTREEALARFDQIWTLFVLAGDIIHRYEDATVELLKSPEQVMIEQVRWAAERYWNQGTDLGPVQITNVWIAGRDKQGDTEVKVSWESEETKDTGNDDMIYTVSVLEGGELSIHGPEW